VSASIATGYHTARQSIELCCFAFSSMVSTASCTGEARESRYSDCGVIWLRRGVENRALRGAAALRHASGVWKPRAKGSSTSANVAERCIFSKVNTGCSSATQTEPVLVERLESTSAEMRCLFHLILLLRCAAWSPAYLQLPTQRYKTPLAGRLAAQQQPAAASFNAEKRDTASDAQFDYWRAW
jgi:hypothetical protein